MKAGKYSDYQKKSRTTWGYVSTEHALAYPTLGLVNEAGEVAGKVKKIFRDKNKQISQKDREALKGELGDVLWYLTQICTELGYTLEEVAEHNIDKLISRKKRGTLAGEGDDR